MLCVWVRFPLIPLTLKLISYEGTSNHRIVDGIMLFAVHFKSKKMKAFEPVKTLSKNKATIGDVFIIEGGERTVTNITTQYVYLDNNKYYMKKMFNSWMRIAKAVATRDMQSEMKNLASKHRETETMIMRKEAKAEYDEKYREPAINRMGVDTSLKLYIVLTGVAETIKFYFSPTFKADIEDLEKSYKSLHGTKYSAFAWGYYIQHGPHIALIGMHEYLGRNLSDKRKAFAMKCLGKETINTYKVIPRLYADMFHMFNAVAKERELLSSSQEPPVQTQKPEQKHWSGLNGDIAQDMLDQSMNQMLEEDDYPF